MKTHELKTWPRFFCEVWDETKRFELRINDRDFKVGDMLYLREYDPVDKCYTGRSLSSIRIIYILKSARDTCEGVDGIESGYVIMGISL